MKSVLIVYGTMSIGGSTTSLLSLLQYFDRSKYEVDLALANNNGELQSMLPKDLNILPALMPENLQQLKQKSLRSIVEYCKAKMYAKKSCNSKNIMGQIMSYENVRLSRSLTKKYDIAISFIENYPLVYVANNVVADKKITWIHVDYKAAGFIPRFDEKCFSKFDKIVLVSDECKKTFDSEFPKLSERSMVIENILTAATVNKLAEQNTNIKVSEENLNIVTVCRISFAHKGLDRVVNAFNKLKQKNIRHNLKWYVIGDGVDYSEMTQRVKEYNLEDTIFLLGAKTRPLPYVKMMDVFLLPSRYEGKPMAVTEAQMLGIPPVVTNYASAAGQIKSQIDGLIVENTDDAVYDALRYLIQNQNEVIKWKNNLKHENFDNMQEIDKIYSIIEENK